jgi:hypothetical protein
LSGWNAAMQLSDLLIKFQIVLILF